MVALAQHDHLVIGRAQPFVAAPPLRSASEYALRSIDSAHAAKTARQGYDARRYQKVDLRVCMFLDELRDCWEGNNEVADKAAIDDQHRLRRCNRAALQCVEAKECG